PSLLNVRSPRHFSRAADVDAIAALFTVADLAPELALLAFFASRAGTGDAGRRAGRLARATVLLRPGPRVRPTGGHPPARALLARLLRLGASSSHGSLLAARAACASLWPQTCLRSPWTMAMPGTVGDRVPRGYFLDRFFAALAQMTASMSFPSGLNSWLIDLGHRLSSQQLGPDQ